MARKRPEPEAHRVALFVEGVTRLTPRGRDDLGELWRFLCGAVSSFPMDRIDVYGFTKQQIVMMDPARADMPGAGTIPLDVFIALTFKRRAFGRLLVAFDAHPANQAILLVDGQATPCLRKEKDFVLSRFAASGVLPKPFRDAASRLLAHYHENRAAPRARVQLPMSRVELVYMSPTFEEMLLQDGKALRDVFGLKKAPVGWPALPYGGDRPDTDLRGIVDGHRLAGPKHLRLRYKEAKHAWAQEILRNAGKASAIWEHAIPQRLGKVLV